MKDYLNLSDLKTKELRSYVSPTAQKTETLLSSADNMPFAKAYPPTRRTVKAYHLSMKKYIKQKRREVAASWGMSLPEYERLQAKAFKILETFDTGHSMGFVAKLKINGKPFARIENTQTYANSCTWRPTHGYFEINLSKAALRGIAQVDGPKWQYKGKILVETGKKNTYKVELI